MNCTRNQILILKWLNLKRMQRATFRNVYYRSFMYAYMIMNVTKDWYKIDIMDSNGFKNEYLCHYFHLIHLHVLF